ncbi:hypothetical protein RhiirA1_466668 [Rhizophagus irregularis]|uniref:Uncharacterized protein n=1 Tax=Rhizophagus irregularis TaxID=588596 RepID=A0A2N0RDF7_9GLOM|nr:hypothetical protein RhiirA1_466668 [Rhizophagus irregularis]
MARKHQNFKKTISQEEKKIKACQEYGKPQAFQTGDGQPSDMLDFDGTERGTQNSAIFDLGICFLRPALLIFRRLEFCMNPASNSEETKYSGTRL